MGASRRSIPNGSSRLAPVRIGSPSKPPAPILQDRLRGVVAGRPGDAAARMRARAAVVEAFERSAVVRIAQHRPRPEQLVERERAVEDVAADEPELLFQI